MAPALARTLAQIAALTQTRTLALEGQGPRSILTVTLMLTIVLVQALILTRAITWPLAYSHEALDNLILTVTLTAPDRR